MSWPQKKPKKQGDANKTVFAPEPEEQTQPDTAEVIARLEKG